MAHNQVCPRCGSPLAEGVAEGLCRRCLLKAGLGDTLTTAQSATPPVGSDTTPLPDFGPYRTIGVLGEGGMGIVYLAEQHEPVRRRVALKVLSRHTASPLAMERFIREARSAAKLDHPNIIRVHDIDTANDPPFIVMEYADGITLTAAVAKAGGRHGLPVARRCRLGAAPQQQLEHVGVAVEPGLGRRRANVALPLAANRRRRA